MLGSRMGVCYWGCRGFEASLEANPHSRLQKGFAFGGARDLEHRPRQTPILGSRTGVCFWGWEGLEHPPLIGSRTGVCFWGWGGLEHPRTQTPL